MSISIISPDALLHLASQSDAVGIIIDARPYNVYAAGHIPGALWMGWEAWCQEPPAYAGPELSQAGYWGLLKDIPDHLDLPELGSNLPIVVYADGPASKGREGRIAWMLLYWGATNVALLNGRWRRWLEVGGSVETSIPVPGEGQFKVNIQEHRRIRFPQLKQAYFEGNIPLLIDARSRLEFDGYNYDYQPRKGRLPGALHIPFSSLFNQAGNYISKEEYLERAPAALLSADQVVAYCEVGVRSCVFALLHELYTGQVVANYDGSMMEWSLHAELPVEISSD